MRILVLVLCLLHSFILCVKPPTLASFTAQIKNPFTHNLGIKTKISDHKNAQIIVCCHGYGHNNNLIDVLHANGITNHHLIGFNFPDHNFDPAIYDHTKASFGTIQELLPLLYLVKQLVIDGSNPVIHLYGFSAGGGAVINALMTLHSSVHDNALLSIGISQADKAALLNALSTGYVLLDCPLKSIEEIIDLRGITPEFNFISKQYAHNNMRPIDSLLKLNNLKTHIICNFEHPDEVIGNRDDILFINRLKQTNPKSLTVLTSKEGGHIAFHSQLWKTFANKLII